MQLWSLGCFKIYLKSELLSGYILDVSVVQDHLIYIIESILFFNCFFYQLAYPDNQELMSIVVYLLGRVIDRKEDIHAGITPTVVDKIISIIIFKKLLLNNILNRNVRKISKKYIFSSVVILFSIFINSSLFEMDTLFTSKEYM